MFLERRVAMKITSFLLVLIFVLTPAMRAQEKPAQAPPGPGSGNQMRAEHRQQLMEMHKQEMEALRADIEKMKSSLAQMKANLLTIKDTNELSRWRNNVDMWETVVTHLDRMQKNMESMGPGMMHGHGMGGPPPTPPTEKKPE
jgi:septal ring factor EnvC (AmiA/AmiB activator)